MTVETQRFCDLAGGASGHEQGGDLMLARCQDDGLAVDREPADRCLPRDLADECPDQ